MSDDPLRALEVVLIEAHFGRSVRDKLAGVRFIHESDEETLDRVLQIARNAQCPACRGRAIGIAGICPICNSTGLNRIVGIEVLP